MAQYLLIFFFRAKISYQLRTDTGVVVLKTHQLTVCIPLKELQPRAQMGEYCVEAVCCDTARIQVSIALDYLYNVLGYTK